MIYKRFFEEIDIHIFFAIFITISFFLQFKIKNKGKNEKE